MIIFCKFKVNPLLTVKITIHMLDSLHGNCSGFKGEPIIYTWFFLFFVLYETCKIQDMIRADKIHVIDLENNCIVKDNMKVRRCGIIATKVQMKWI